jgi:hypothetical protein
MYDFNPNFGLLDDFAPAANTLAARAVADDGTVCRWVNQTSGATVDIGLSRPAPTSLASAQDAARSGTPVSGLGDAAYFSVSGGVGVLQAFSDGFWVTTASGYFGAPEDAEPIMAAALAATR